MTTATSTTALEAAQDTLADLQAKLSTERLKVEIATARIAKAEDAEDKSEWLDATAHRAMATSAIPKLEAQVIEATAVVGAARASEFANQVVPHLQELDALVLAELDELTERVESLIAAHTERDAAVQSAHSVAMALGDSERVTTGRPYPSIDRQYALRSTRSELATELNILLHPLFRAVQESVTATDLLNRSKNGNRLPRPKNESNQK